jgi:putative membrane protein
MIIRGVFATMVAAAFFCVMGTPARAQEDNYGGLNAMDHKFAQNAAAAGLAKISLGQLAQEKSQNAAVKEFGKFMVSENTKLSEQLKVIFAQEKLQFPANLNDEYEAAYKRLAQLSGAAFDKAYVQEMLDEYTQDIAEYELQSSSGQDAAITQFATKTLPTLRDYLKAATQMVVQIEPADPKPNKKR